MIACPWGCKNYITFDLLLVGILSMITGLLYRMAAAVHLLLGGVSGSPHPVLSPFTQHMGSAVSSTPTCSTKFSDCRFSDGKIPQKAKTDFPASQCLLTWKPTDSRPYVMSTEKYSLCPLQGILP